MFKGLKIAGLTEQDAGEGMDTYGFMLIEGEEVKCEYKTVRDMVILTNKRLITIDVQGITGKKKEFFVLPFSKITAFAIESAGTFDMDAEFKIWASGIGELEINFLKGTDVSKIAKVLSAGIV
ncbi:PH domain-containing protein [Vibrio sp. JC009]|uniref:PH domain-containing protein n=1 Tax=Vibrio sp. JC009 TaxID=2912314 RepID=UPI0023B17447|nr:PH domain-containing protein [Vibrio sp. JC009]WED24590.1 PH domain-containing protein [Vibrio sp. JC009]